MEKKDFYNSYEEKLLKIYENLNIGNSEICKQCKMECHNKNLSKPNSAWLVGNNLDIHDKRILFVGKNARGGEYEENTKFTNHFYNSRKGLWYMNWPYWNYTKCISNKIFGDDSPENIAFTNLIKCNFSLKEDTTTDEMKNNCIVYLKVIREEIKIIKPNKIIFYTNTDYDKFIPKIFDTFNLIYNKKEQIGQKTMPWGEYTGIINSSKIDILRVGHPERKCKSDFINKVCNWLNK